MFGHNSSVGHFPASSFCLQNMHFMPVRKSRFSVKQIWGRVRHTRAYLGTHLQRRMGRVLERCWESQLTVMWVWSLRERLGGCLSGGRAVLGSLTRPVSQEAACERGAGSAGGLCLPALPPRRLSPWPGAPVGSVASVRAWQWASGCSVCACWSVVLPIGRSLRSPFSRSPQSVLPQMWGTYHREYLRWF